MRYHIMNPISHKKPVDNTLSLEIQAIAADLNADAVISRDDGDEYTAKMLIEYRDRLLDAIGY